MLDTSPPTGPAWTGTITFGDLVQFRFPDPDNRNRRPGRLCAVSDFDWHHGALFIALVPTIPAQEMPIGPRDIPLNSANLISAHRPAGRALWLRPDLAERVDTAHPGFEADKMSRTPIAGHLTGNARGALAAFQARQRTLRAAHIAWHRARRRSGRKR